MSVMKGGMHGRPTLPMADSTTQGYCSGKLHTMSATSRMRSADTSEEPPNFMTTVICPRDSKQMLSTCRGISALLCARFCA